MARTYEPVPGSGFYCRSLEKCEEEIVIDALVEISGLIPPDQKWQQTLEYYFFERGKGLADEALIEIDRVRNHHGLGPIQIRETAVSDYALSRDEDVKSQRRRQTREELCEASPEVRAERLTQAKAEEERLPPYEDFRIRRLQQNATRPLGQGDIARRPSTWRAGDAPEVIHIGTRLLPRSEKQANFQRLLPDRTAKVREAIHGLRNLSSPNYEYDDAEAEKIFPPLFELLEDARATFRRRLTKRKRG